MFGACGGQWAYLPAGQGRPLPTGIPSERAESRARALGVDWNRDLLWRFGLLEAEAIDAMTEG